MNSLCQDEKNLQQSEQQNSQNHAMNILVTNNLCSQQLLFDFKRQKQSLEVFH